MSTVFQKNFVFNFVYVSVTFEKCARTSVHKNPKLYVKDTVKAFHGFNNKQIFWYVKNMYILKMYSIAIHWDKTYVKKLSFGQNKQFKKCPLLFFCELQLIIVLLLNCDSYMSWSTNFFSPKLCKIFQFQFRFVFVKVYIFVKKNGWTRLL